MDNQLLNECTLYISNIHSMSFQIGVNHLIMFCWLEPIPPFLCPMVISRTWNDECFMHWWSFNPHPHPSYRVFSCLSFLDLSPNSSALARQWSFTGVPSSFPFFSSLVPQGHPLKKSWWLRDSNPQTSNLKHDALPSRYKILFKISRLIFFIIRYKSCTT